MKPSLLVYGACSILALAGVTAAWANGQQEQQPQVLRGETQTRNASGAWSADSQLKAGAWFRSAKPETTVKIPGAVLRIEKGASVRYTAQKADASSLNLSTQNGRVYVSLDPQVSCKVNSRYEATGGEFVLDSNSSKLYVMEGDAHEVHPKKPTIQPLSSWAKSADSVALDGPDVRKRNRNRRRFTQGEENKGKRIGEDQPPATASPRPTATESPAYTPSPSVTPQPPNPSPTPPPSNNPPPAVSGGTNWLPIALGVAGAGGLGYFISRNVGGNDDTPRFFGAPASP